MKKLKSISADNSLQLTQFVNELEIQQESIVSIVWVGNHLSMFYYD